MLDKLFCFVQILFFTVVVSLWSISVSQDTREWSFLTTNDSTQNSSHSSLSNEYPFVSYSESLFYNGDEINFTFQESQRTKYITEFVPLTKNLVSYVVQSKRMSSLQASFLSILYWEKSFITTPRFLFFWFNIRSRREIHLYDLQYLWDSWFFPDYVELLL